MPRIKVAFFAEILIPDIDGASRTMFQLLERIPQDEFEFLFICARGPEMIGSYECIRLPRFQIPVNKTYQFAIPGLAKKFIREKLDAFKPDVVHIATPSLLGFYALKYANLSNIPTISIYHTHFLSYVNYYLKHLPFLIDPIRRRMKEKITLFYNGCAKVYVPSASMIQELATIGVNPAQMQLWKRGIDTRIFNPLKKDPRYIRTLTGNDRPSIFFASRLVWEKNLETLVQIYALMQQMALPYNFVIAGDGTAKNMLKQQMPKALFLGNLDQDTLANVYASSSVFVFPSNTETFGNVVLEAMASGLPCVISDEGGSRDFIEDGVNGFKCGARDAWAFVENIRLLLDNAKLARQFSQESLAKCSLYDWDKLASIYFDDLCRLSSHKPHKIAS